MQSLLPNAQRMRSVGGRNDQGSRPMRRITNKRDPGWQSPRRTFDEEHAVDALSLRYRELVIGNLDAGAMNDNRARPAHRSPRLAPTVRPEVAAIIVADQNNG